MKIDSSYKTASASTSPAKPRETPAPSPDSAEVHLSAAAARLSAGESAPVDRARVSAIKKAIADGSFKINTGAIADSLIDTARELIASRRQG